jgi:hypothetical protein
MRQDGHRIADTVRRATTQRLKSRGTIVNRLPLVYKWRRRPLAARTMDSSLTRFAAFTHDISSLTQSDLKDLGILLLSRLACCPLYEHHSAL